SVAELLARNGQKVPSRSGGRRRRGTSGGISVAELTGEIPITSAAPSTTPPADPAVVSGPRTPRVEPVVPVTPRVEPVVPATPRVEPVVPATPQVKPPALETPAPPSVVEQTTIVAPRGASGGRTAAA